MRKIIILATLLMLAPLGTAAAQQKPQPAPRPICKDGDALTVICTQTPVVAPASMSATPVASPSPTPKPRRTYGSVSKSDLCTTTIWFPDEVICVPNIPALPAPSPTPRRLFSSGMACPRPWFTSEGVICLPVTDDSQLPSPTPEASPSPTPRQLYSRTGNTTVEPLPPSCVIRVWFADVVLCIHKWGALPRNSVTGEVKVEDYFVTGNFPIEPNKVVDPTPSPTPQSRKEPGMNREPPERVLGRFLVLPFSKKDRDKISISAGDTYSEEEQGIHHFTDHYATDFNAPEDTKVYAPCDGRAAVQARHTNRLRRDGKFVLYKGKVVGFGLGNFVQIRCTAVEVNVVMGHLKTVNDKIPQIFSVTDENGDITPNGRLSQLNDTTLGIEVKVGDFIGTVGRTGLGWGDDAGNIYAMFYWDKDHHLHFEAFKRRDLPETTKDPKARWDPLGWYKQYSAKSYFEFRQHSKYGLFLEDKYHLFKFARN